ncbi:MAG: helix-turn-helix domain-containing protein [Solirubrobacteraceae bacterium]
MTLETVSEDSWLDMKQIGSYARGHGNPTFESLLKLCKGLHVDPKDLLSRVEELLKRRLES